MIGWGRFILPCCFRYSSCLPVPCMIPGSAARLIFGGCPLFCQADGRLHQKAHDEGPLRLSWRGNVMIPPPVVFVKREDPCARADSAFPPARRMLLRQRNSGIHTCPWSYYALRRFSWGEVCLAVVSIQQISRAKEVFSSFRTAFCIPWPGSTIHLYLVH